jgi:hypothetical protein
MQHICICIISYHLSYLRNLIFICIVPSSLCTLLFLVIGIICCQSCCQLCEGLLYLFWFCIVWSSRDLISICFVLCCFYHWNLLHIPCNFFKFVIISHLYLDSCDFGFFNLFFVVQYFVWMCSSTMLNKDCYNPGFGLTTKARACKGASQ